MRKSLPNRHLPIPVNKRGLVTRAPYKKPDFKVRKEPEKPKSLDSFEKPNPPESYESLKGSLTDEELQSLQDVCNGRVDRQESLVSDAKFDRILESLQSLGKTYTAEEAKRELGL